VVERSDTTGFQDASGSSTPEGPRRGTSLLRPLRGRGVRLSIAPGGIAALNHRLIAGTPPGSEKTKFALEVKAMMQTLEGIFRNGKVELLEKPDNVHEARVIVTFLPAVMEPEGGGLHSHRNKLQTCGESWRLGKKIGTHPAWRPTMTTKRGDVVLVRFPPSDLRGGHRRPALVVQADGLGTAFPCQRFCISFPSCEGDVECHRSTS